MSAEPAATLDKSTRRVDVAAAPPGGIAPELRERIAQAFTRVEDVVYVGLGLLLTAGALVLLIDAGVMLGRQFLAAMPGPIIELLDRILLIVMIVELLYTVQVSLREHTLVPEPFLVVGMIAGIRRILVLTAEFSEMLEQGGSAFRNAMLELCVLTAMVLALVAAVVLLRRRATPPAADKS